MPGSYRIIDLFCFKEVLNQIMKCSCQAEGGFVLYQNTDQIQVNSFHSVLDVVCRNCTRKVSFGTSTIVDMVGSAIPKPDIDVKINSFLDSYEEKSKLCIVRGLWAELHRADSRIMGGPSICSWLESPATAVDVGQQPSDTLDLFPDTNCDLDEAGGGEEHITGLLGLQDQESRYKSHEGTLEHSSIERVVSEEIGGSLVRGRSCPHCKKQFKKAFNLKQHIRTHTNEKPLKCDICLKRFNDRSSMNKHVRTMHVDFKPHKCSVCDKNFASTSHLSEHMVKHTNQRRFQCEKCNKKFAFRSSLNKHMNSEACRKMMVE